MNTPDHDGAFVDDLLRQARAALDDPRVTVVHVRHAGPRPSNAPDPLAGRAAWAQTLDLASTLRELWTHAWLPDPPTVADVRYLDGAGGLRVEVSAYSRTTEDVDVDAAADRLLVRGFLSHDPSPPGRIRVRDSSRELVVDATNGGVAMTLSEALHHTEHTTLDTVAALPQQVSLTPDS